MGDLVPAFRKKLWKQNILVFAVFHVSLALSLDRAVYEGAYSFVFHNFLRYYRKCKIGWRMRSATQHTIWDLVVLVIVHVEVWEANKNSNRDTQWKTLKFRVKSQIERPIINVWNLAFIEIKKYLLTEEKLNNNNS
jgi:hypothetical protein